jgi:glycosyltransferase involved in cell wall biosynthesis
MAEPFLKNGAYLIIVDDGSQDASRNLLEPLTLQYPNVKFLATANYGSAYARNLCLEKLCTEFFMFWDIDDFLYAETVFIALHEFRMTKADVAVTNFVTVPKGRIGKIPAEEYSGSIVNTHSIAIEILEAMGYWRYIYKKSVFLDKYQMRFIPTRSELMNSQFILDDLFWILELALQKFNLLILPSYFTTYGYRTSEILAAESWEKYQVQVVDIPKAVLIFENYLSNKQFSKSDDKQKLYKYVLKQHFGFLNFYYRIKFLLNLINIAVRKKFFFWITLQLIPYFALTTAKHLLVRFRANIFNKGDF